MTRPRRIVQREDTVVKAVIPSTNQHPGWVAAGVVVVVALVWAVCLYSIASQVGGPFPGFFYSPDRLVSGFTPQEFAGWQAGLRPGDRIVAVNGHSPREIRRLVRETGISGVLAYTVERGGETMQVMVPTMPFTWDIVLRFVPAYIFCALLCVATGLFVYLHDPASRLNRGLLIYLSSYAGFLLVWEYYLSQVKWTAYLMHIWVAEVCVAGWIFFWSFPADQERRAFLSRWPLVPLFVTLAVVASIFYPAFLAAASRLDQPEWWRAYTLSATWGSFVVFGGGTFVNKTLPQIRVLRRKDAPPLIRQQAWVLLIGISLSLIGFVPLFWAPFSLHIRPLANPQWGGIIAAFYPLLIGYAVLRYGLFDFRVVVRKGLAYSLLTAALTAIFLFLSLVIGYLFQALTGQQTILAALLPALFVAFLFQPVRGQVQILVDRIFFRREYEVRQTLTAFGQGLNTLRERSEVTRLVLDTVRDTLGAENAKLWLLEDGRYRSDETMSSRGFSAESDLVARLTLERHPAVAHRGDSAAYDKSLDRAGVAVAVPLLVGETLSGILTLGSRRSGDPYSQDDLDLLTNLAHNTALALENARLHEERVATLRQQLARVTAAQEEERQRIARDLHDGVGPALASMNLRLRTLGKLLNRDPSLAVAQIEELADLAQANVRDIRRLIYDLRPAALDELGLVPALRDHLDRCQREHGLIVEFSADDGNRLPAPLETALFRIVQEAVNNVVRHARARHVRVTLSRSPHCTVLRVADDGQGFDPKDRLSSEHLGLWSIRERVRQFGGSFDLHSAPGQGTVLDLKMPSESNVEAEWTRSVS
jgi:signal transduction histidine kinase